MGMCYCVDISMNTPWSYCGSATLVVVRIRGVIWLMTLLPTIINLVLFFVSEILSGNAFAMTIARICDGIDQGIGLPVPIAKVLCYAALFRTAKDMKKVHMQIEHNERQRVILERSKLEKEKGLLEAELTGRYATRDVLMAKISQVQADQIENKDHSGEGLVKIREEMIDQTVELYGMFNAKAKDIENAGRIEAEKIARGEGELGWMADLQDTSKMKADAEAAFAEVKKEANKAQARSSHYKQTEDPKKKRQSQAPK